MLRYAILFFALAGSQANPSPTTWSEAKSLNTAGAFARYKFEGDWPLPIRQAHEDWAAARDRWESDVSARSWVQSRQTNLDNWRMNHTDRVDWIAGWSHNLLDLQTGLPMAWNWAMPEPADSTPAEQKVHGAWVASVRDANIRIIGDAVRLWKLTGNTDDLKWATEQIDLYAGGYGNWPIQTLNGQSQMMGQSLDEATTGIVLADAMRIIGDAVPEYQRQKWRADLLKPMLTNLQRSNRGENNIAVWQAAAEAIISCEVGDKEAFKNAIDGPAGIRAMLSRGVTSDKLWFEPSIGYGQYVQRALGSLFTYLSLTGLAEPLRAEMLVTQDMIASEASMRFKDGTLPGAGDSMPGSLALSSSLLTITQRTLPLRVPMIPLGWETLLDPNMPAAPTPREQVSRFWPSWQAAMLRRNGWEVFTTWGQQSTSHAQGDALSYELRYNNEVVSGPAGTANYGSQLFLNYLRTSSAHNQPMIDGDGQVKFGPGMLISSNNASVSARHPGFGTLTNVVRTLKLNEKSASIKTQISTGASVHRLGDVFNTACRVTPAAPLLPRASPSGKGFSWWRDTRSSGPIRWWSANIACGNETFILTVRTSKQGVVYVSAAPDRNGLPKRTAIYFETPAAAVLTVIWRIENVDDGKAKELRD